MRYQKALQISTVCCGIVFLLGISFLSSCGSDPVGFQENQIYDYKLFDLLDKYPALHDAVHLKDPNNTQYRSDQCDKQQIRLDQCVVDTLLNDVINEHYKENIEVMASQYLTIGPTTEGTPTVKIYGPNGEVLNQDPILNQYPMQNTVQLMRHLIYRINNQNDLDSGLFNPNSKRRGEIGAFDYAAKFFGFLDDINNKNLNLGKELVTIMRMMTKFRNDTFTPALMKKEVEFALNDMDAKAPYYAFCNPQSSDYNETTCDNYVLARHRSLVYQQTSVGKSNLQADYPMWLDNAGNLITRWENINSGDSKPTGMGIGNAVQGNQSLMMALFELVKDKSFRDNLYDNYYQNPQKPSLIGELGKFLSGSVPTHVASSERIKIADVAENLVRNIASYFTTGGAKATGDYAADDDATYSSAELRNTLRELAPGNTRLMLRSDREKASVIYEIPNVNGKKLYLVDELIKSLRLLDWDPDKARIEESLEDILRYDQYGRDRTNTSKCNDSTDTSSCPHKASLLESLFFLHSAATNYGWTDAATDGGGGEVEDPNASTLKYKNYGHGHGKSRAVSTLNTCPTKCTGSSLNDNLFALGTNKIFGYVPLYDAIFSPDVTDDNSEHLFRSMDPAYMARFSITGDTANHIPKKDDYKFSFDQNYPISDFLVIGAGPLASPTGGKNKINSNGKPILNSYKPFQHDGLENDTLAVVTLDANWHIVWNGYSPYYYDPELAGKTPEYVTTYGKKWKKLYRANGKLYALVHKPDPPRDKNLEYLYPPNDENEPLWPVAMYYGKIDDPNTSVFTSSIDLSGAGVSPNTTTIPPDPSPPYKFSISMGTIYAEVQINISPVIQSEVISKINDAIDTAAGAKITACYPFDDNYIKIKNPYGGNIVLADITPGALNFLLLDPTLEGATSPYTVPLNAMKLDGPAKVKITIDGNAPFIVEFSSDTIWDRDQIVLYLKDHVFPNPFWTNIYGKDRFVIAGDPTGNPKIIKIEYVSGTNNAVEMLFGGNGNSIIREQNREQAWSSVAEFDHYIGYFLDAVTNLAGTIDYVDRYSTIYRDNNNNIKLFKLSETNKNTPDKYLYKVEANGVAVQENIDDNDISRACASQEEAFFRNYQWFFNEKKFLIIIPMRQFSMGGELGIVYQYVETNGYYGLSNVRALKGNHLWAKTGKSGSSKVPGDSRIGIVLAPSDAAKKTKITGDFVYNTVLGGGAGFGAILAHNSTSVARLAFPTVTTGQVTRIGQNGIPYTEQFVDSLVPSYGFTVGDSVWNRRNAFAPIVMSLVNALRANSDNTRTNTTGIATASDMMTILLKPITYYQKGSGAFPQNSWKMRVLGDAEDANFIKSSAEFYMEAGKYVKSKIGWFGGWPERDYYQMPHLNTLLSVLIDSDRYGSNEKIMDGILPLLVAEYDTTTHARPQVLTQVFKLLLNLGDSKFDDSSNTNYDLSSDAFDNLYDKTFTDSSGTHNYWGARRKLFYGLEQVATLSKNTKGTFTKIGDAISKINSSDIEQLASLPDWMFTNGVNANCDCMVDRNCMPDDMRPEEIFANIDQNILVGTNDYNEYLEHPNGIKPGELGYQMGLAYLPHDWEKNPDKLTLFHNYLNMTSELLKPQGEYSVVENVINVVKKFFEQVSPTNDQVKGLVHTLGIVATTYDYDPDKNPTTKTWRVAEVPLTNGKISFSDHKFDLSDNSRVDDLYRVAAQYQPIINTIALILDTGVKLTIEDNGKMTTLDSTSNYLYDSSVYFNALLKAGGLMEYVLDVVDTRDKFSEIFSELYNFLDEPLFKTFDSTLWKDIAKLMAGQVEVLTKNDSATAASDKYQNFGFQYNGPN